MTSSVMEERAMTSSRCTFFRLFKPDFKTFYSDSLSGQRFFQREKPKPKENGTHRWSAVCGESRMHGVKRGKRQRSHQSLTYRYKTH